MCVERSWGELSCDAVRVVVAGARWERGAGGAAAELERRLFAAAAPQHRLLPRLLHLLLAPQTSSEHDATALVCTLHYLKYISNGRYKYRSFCYELAR